MLTIQKKKKYFYHCTVGDKIIQEVIKSGASDNFPKYSYLMILRPKEKLGQLSRQSPEVPCNLKYSVTL